MVPFTIDQARTRVSLYVIYPGFGFPASALNGIPNSAALVNALAGLTEYIDPISLGSPPSLDL